MHLTDKPTGQIKAAIRDLPPSYFAMVMATGTLSVSCELLGAPMLAWLLLLINTAAYGIFIVIYACRIIWFPRNVFADLINHKKGAGFFTAVASTCVFGSQYIIVAHNFTIATALWVVAIILWVGLTYTIFTAYTIVENKPQLQEAISGAWLLAVVATQGIALLSALLASHWRQPIRLELNFLALSMWLWGGMLYIWMISLIFYRYTFFEFKPDDLSPPYWINMGAMAISTLAGTRLIQNAPDAWYLNSLLPFLKGFTIFYWATGTWWIPMLLILGVWRHVYKHQPLKYDPLYWGAVFPLAMYTTCTFKLAEAMQLDFLYIIPKVFIYIAFTAWTAAFYGLSKRLIRHLIPSK